jgi:uncharacterized protein
MARLTPPRPLTANDDRQSFDCGRDSLNGWFRRNGWRNQQMDVSRVSVMCDTRSYLERDVPMFAPRMPGVTIGRLWTMLAHGQGTLLNLARLGQALNVSAPMVGRYVDLLVDLLLVRRLQPWSGNLQKRLVRAPKIYVRDAGLVHSLLDIGSIDQLLGHPVSGLSWEGFVIEALINAAGPDTIPMFYRTHDGAELDLVLERAGVVAFAIEIKRSTAPKMSLGLTISAADIGAQRRILVHGGDDNYVAGNGVEVKSLSTAMEAVQYSL